MTNLPTAGQVIVYATRYANRTVRQASDSAPAAAAGRLHLRCLACNPMTTNQVPAKRRAQP